MEHLHEIDVAFVIYIAGLSGHGHRVLLGTSTSHYLQGRAVHSCPGVRSREICGMHFANPMHPATTRQNGHTLPAICLYPEAVGPFWSIHKVHPAGIEPDSLRAARDSM